MSLRVKSCSVNVEPRCPGASSLRAGFETDQESISVCRLVCVTLGNLLTLGLNFHVGKLRMMLLLSKLLWQVNNIMCVRPGGDVEMGCPDGPARKWLEGSPQLSAHTVSRGSPELVAEIGGGTWA